MDTPLSAPQLLDYARAILAQQPFSQWLGAELVSADREHACLTLPVTPSMLQQHGFVHGGVLSYLADNSLTFAGGLALGGNALTSEFKINYLRPAQGQQLRAEARVVGAGRRQAVTRCEIWCEQDGQSKLCAVAQGTIVSAG